MVHRNRARSSSLFLMELIFAILFFAVASAVCVQFFVKSHLMSRDSEVLTYSVNECSGVAEIICLADSLQMGVDLLRQQYPEGMYPEQSEVEAGDLTILLYYDETWSPCGPDVPAYVMQVKLTQEEQMLEAVLEMERNGTEGEAAESVYRLEAKHHIARRTDLDER